MRMRYFIGEVEQTFIRRIVKTKTFYSATSILLGSVGVALEGTVGWKAAIVGGVISAALVVARDLKAKADLKAQAEDPNISAVTAVPKETK